MSLKDRIKAKKQTKITTSIDNTIYNISISKVTKAIANIENTSDLGNIIKEFAKFLNTLEPQNAKITISGDFDMGQKTLLNCILASFLEEKTTANKQETVTDNSEERTEPKLIKKRKSVKERIAESSQE